jgi:hypothetical protein
MTQRWPAVVLALVIVAATSPAFAQGLQTGIVTGTVVSSDDAPLPGVTIVATSPALLGERVALTDLNGVYSFAGLPAGSYDLTFDLQGFQSARRGEIAVNVGGTVEVNATLPPATVAETVTVTAAAPPGVSTAVTSLSITKRDVDALPIGRRPVDIAELAPGLTANTFFAGQLAISGGFGYDNVFMIDGVDVNDTITGTANNVFIEDAVQETTVLTNGIPAEYGRFSGGVVNLVTRSGGNAFSGSFRENLSNPDWIAETPFQRQNRVVNPSILGKTSEATLGGPVMKDRLWFFAAGRWEKTSTANTFAQTGAAYTRTDTNRRGEVKLTGRLRAADMLQGTFVNNGTEQANTSPIAANRLVDASTLVTRQLPNWLATANYNGAVGSSLFVRLQYSQKVQKFRNNGGNSPRLADSPFRTLGATAGVPPGLIYHAPYLDSTDPEQRNNHQVTGSISRLLSPPRAGTHDLKAGAEHFVSTGIGGNSQSSTGFVLVTDYLVSNGVPVLDAGGAPVPRFIPGVTEAWTFLAARGARIDIKTTSLYVQDRWSVGRRLTLDLGTRFEAVRSDATGDITAVDTTTIVPRLAAIADLRGDGRTTAQVSYGHYSGKYGQVQFSSNSNVSRPSEVDYLYSGPAGEGAGFAPGFDPSNYTQVIFASFPTANVKVADDLHSPITRELTLGAGQLLGDRGYAKATYAWRKTTGVVEDFLDLSGGIVDVPLVGRLTNRVFANSEVPRRSYSALLLQMQYRLGARITAGGHYTMQIRNHGNFAGESAGVPGGSSIYGDFPEIYGPALDRLMPEGPLDSFQRHKLRMYGTYTQPMGRFGSLDLAPIWRVNSGLAYSLTASIPLPAAQLARNPGYPVTDISPAVRESVFFGERGENEFMGYGVVDLAATYAVPVWKSAAPWLKVEFYNLLNNQKLIAWDRTVTADPASALDANGIRTGYLKGPRFGSATNDNQFPQPYLAQNGGRAFRMALGVRF